MTASTINEDMMMMMMMMMTQTGLSCLVWRAGGVN